VRACVRACVCVCVWGYLYVGAGLMWMCVGLPVCGCRVDVGVCGVTGMWVQG
jgi:hypothetical protein